MANTRRVRTNPNASQSYRSSKMGGGTPHPPTYVYLGSNQPTRTPDDSSDISAVKTKINGAFLWLGLLTTALASVFLFFINRIDDVRKDLTSVQTTLAGQSATIESIKSDTGKISEKLDQIADFKNSNKGK